MARPGGPDGKPDHRPAPAAGLATSTLEGKTPPRRRRAYRERPSTPAWRTFCSLCSSLSTSFSVARPAVDTAAGRGPCGVRPPSRSGGRQPDGSAPRCREERKNRMACQFGCELIARGVWSDVKEGRTTATPPNVLAQDRRRLIGIRLIDPPRTRPSTCLSSRRWCRLGVAAGCGDAPPAGRARRPAPQPRQRRPRPGSPPCTTRR